MTGITIGVLIILFILWKMFKIIPQKQTGIKERFGKYTATLKPGFHFLLPFVESIAYRHEMREQVIDVSPQHCITRDNVQVEVDGIVYIKVMDAYKASYGIADYIRAMVNLAQTTMRSEVGKLTLDHTFSERDKINEMIIKEIDKASEPWGVKTVRYEIKNITPTREMLNTMEKQMEAERQKRANITMAEADREYKINISTGKRQAKINNSEGEKQKRINLAKGRAKKIELISTATSQGLQKVSAAINNPGGDHAVKMRITEQFLEEYGNVLSRADVSVVPTALANVQGFFQGLSEVNSSLTNVGAKKITSNQSSKRGKK